MDCITVEKVFKLSITEGGKEEKCEVIALCTELFGREVFTNAAREKE